MNKAKHIKPGGKGFTLIELLIAMVVAGIVTAAVYAAFQSQQRSSIVQENVNVMQQNLRAAMEIMIKDIRMAGYDPALPAIGGLGISDVRPMNKDGITVDITISGNGRIEFSADFNENGALDGGETVSYSIYDFPVASPDGKPDLARNVGGGRQLLAENIEALGFAFAFDADQDGDLDTYDAVNIIPAPATPEERRRVIWAIDSDGDNLLDRNLDTDRDGIIDADDDMDLNNLIEGRALVDFDGNAIANVALADIQAVRIWMLARTDRGDDRFLNKETYVVGHKVIIPRSDADLRNCRMRLLETIVRCRNLEF